MRFLCSLGLVIALLLGLGGRAYGQSDCEAGIRQRLAEALQVDVALLTEVTRDYSPGLFPGVTFYRAEQEQGFHARTRHASLALVNDEPLLVQTLADLAPLWQRLFAGNLPPSEVALLAVRELLFQTGLLQRGDQVVASESEVSDTYRAFLTPGSDLSAIRAPKTAVSDSSLSLSFFAQTSEGLVRYSAVVPKDGALRVSRNVVAQLQMN